MPNTRGMTAAAAAAAARANARSKSEEKELDRDRGRPSEHPLISDARKSGTLRFPVVSTGADFASDSSEPDHDKEDEEDDEETKDEELVSTFPDLGLLLSTAMAVIVMIGRIIAGERGKPANLIAQFRAVLTEVLEASNHDPATVDQVTGLPVLEREPSLKAYHRLSGVICWIVREIASLVVGGLQCSAAGRQYKLRLPSDAQFVAAGVACMSRQPTRLIFAESDGGLRRSLLTPASTPPPKTSRAEGAAVAAAATPATDFWNEQVRRDRHRHLPEELRSNLAFFCAIVRNWTEVPTPLFEDFAKSVLSEDFARDKGDNVLFRRNALRESANFKIAHQDTVEAIQEARHQRPEDRTTPSESSVLIEIAALYMILCRPTRKLTLYHYLLLGYNRPEYDSMCYANPLNMTGTSSSLVSSMILHIIEPGVAAFKAGYKEEEVTGEYLHKADYVRFSAAPPAKTTTARPAAAQDDRRESRSYEVGRLTPRDAKEGKWGWHRTTGICGACCLKMEHGLHNCPKPHADFDRAEPFKLLKEIANGRRFYGGDRAP